jgi:DNA-binding beta-propeller fold protein YncE
MRQKSLIIVVIGGWILSAGGCSDSDTGDAGMQVTASSSTAAIQVQEPTPVVAAAGQGVAAECEASGELQYVCGPENAEDILQIGRTRWLITSGMNGNLWGRETPGRLYLVNHETRDWEVLFPREQPAFEQDMTMFPDCPGPLNVKNFSGHGLALRKQDSGQYLLYITSHGDREAIEAFRLDATGTKPTVTWIGCVVLPDTTWPNSVAILGDGGFVTTKFMDPTDTEAFTQVRAGEITGGVYEWHPGDEVKLIPGTELSGANGILVSEDDRWMYVAAFGTNEVVRFDRSGNPPAREVIAMDVTPDNLRWTVEGNIYTAGHNHMPVADCPEQPCGDGWSVYEIDPETMTSSRINGVGPDAVLQGASSAQLVDEEIWIGTYAGDRIGILPRP